MLLFYSTLQLDVIGRLYIAFGWLHTVVGWLNFVLRYSSTLYLLIPHFSLCSHTAVNNIHLVLYGDLHVQQALALVAADEAYSEVLQLEFKPRVEGQDDDEQPQVLQAAAPNPVLNAAIMKTKDQHVEGEVPPHFPEQASYSSHASSSLCLDNQEQYSRIAYYMLCINKTACFLSQLCLTSLQFRWNKEP